MILERWQRLLLDLKKIEASDMNRKIGNYDLGVAGNNPEVSYGGSLLRDLLANGEYVLVNNTKNVSGGPFTRFDPANPMKKSLLDLIIISRSLLKYLDELTIDTDFKFPIQHPIKAGGKTVMKKSDHVPLVLKLKNLPHDPAMRKKDVKVSKWNFNKPGGWNKYKQLTNEEVLPDFDDDVTADGHLEKFNKKMKTI